MWVQENEGVHRGVKPVVEEPRSDNIAAAPDVCKGIESHTRRGGNVSKNTRHLEYMLRLDSQQLPYHVNRAEVLSRGLFRQDNRKWLRQSCAGVTPKEIEREDVEKGRIREDEGSLLKEAVVFYFNGNGVRDNA